MHLRLCFSWASVKWNWLLGSEWKVSCLIVFLLISARSVIVHVDDLIFAVRPLIPFGSEAEAQIFLDRYENRDQIALISVFYFGRSHIHYNEVGEDYKRYLFSGEMNRFWEGGNIPEEEFAKVIYEKNINLHTCYDAFLRCTDGVGYDHSKY